MRTDSGTDLVRRTLNKNCLYRGAREDETSRIQNLEAGRMDDGEGEAAVCARYRPVNMVTDSLSSFISGELQLLKACMSVSNIQLEEPEET